MFQIAITGGIACGKTTIGRSLESWGYPVWEADEAARVLLAPGQSGYEWAVQTFGGRVTRADGSINREVLARLVFADGTALQALNSLVHPRVLNDCRCWMETCSRKACRAAFAVIPLLFEAGMDAGWDAIWCVVCDERIQADRMRERGWDAVHAKQRCDAQWLMAQKMERADCVLINNGDRAVLEEQLRRSVNRLAAR